MEFRDHCSPSQNQTFEEGQCAGLLPRVEVGLTHFGSLEILRRLEWKGGVCVYFPAGFTERGIPVTNCTLLPVIGGENYLPFP